jgi:sulfur-carrier protein
LREAAGVSQVEAEGRDVSEIVSYLSSKFGDRFEQIAGVSSFVINGERATRSSLLADGDELAILPPVSGGAVSNRTTCGSARTGSP